MTVLGPVKSYILVWTFSVVGWLQALRGDAADLQHRHSGGLMAASPRALRAQHLDAWGEVGVVEQIVWLEHSRAMI